MKKVKTKVYSVQLDPYHISGLEMIVEERAKKGKYENPSRILREGLECLFERNKISPGMIHKRLRETSEEEIVTVVSKEKVSE